MTLRGKTASYSYDAAGRLAERILPNGLKVAYQYDDADRVTEMAYRKADGTSVETLTYAYDAAGQRRQRGSGSASVLETAFSAAYDEANQLTQITLGGEVFTLAYDDNGNLTTKSGPVSGTTTYTWSARDQLISLSSPAGVASFKYDALGRRIEKTVNGQSTGFLYDGAQAIAELKGSALDTVYHTGLAIDEVLARYGSSGNKTLLTDALMSVIAQTNDAQNADNFYAYSPYGEATTLGPDEGNPLQYTGRENDGTGLYYYRARYYDAVLNRFISEDPVGMEAGPNFYAYVGGNPVSFVDPSGNFGLPGLILGGAVIVGAGIAIYQGYQGIQNITQANQTKNDFYNQVANNPSSVSANTAGQALQAQGQAIQGAGQVGNAGAQLIYPPVVLPASKVPVPNLPSIASGTGNAPRYPIFPTNNPNGQIYCPGYTR